MIFLIIYAAILLLELIFAISIAAFALGMLYSSFMGAPYVPTKKKELIEFLKAAKIKKRSIFLEIGCGDGRVVRTAANSYGAEGIGVDINPLLIIWARFLNWFHREKKVTFKTENVFKTDFTKADTIYIFLMPEMVVKLRDKLKKTKKGALIISHGFKIEGWEKYCFNTIHNKPFPTYYYRLSK